MRERPRIHPLDSPDATANPATIPAPRRDHEFTQDAVEVDAVLAGFIRWLAEGSLPPSQRRGCYQAVERFRSWHTGRRHHSSEPSDHRSEPGHDLRRHDIVYGRRRYLTALRAAGHSHTEIAAVDTALEQLCRYLEHPHHQAR